MQSYICLIFLLFSSSCLLKPYPYPSYPPLDPRVSRFVENNQNAMLADLTDLVNIGPDDSFSDREVTRQKLITFIKKVNAEQEARRDTPLYRIRAKTILDDQIGIVEMGEGNETVGILTHMDVVEGPAQMRMLRVDQGYLYGRGVQDDKGPLISVYYGMRAIQDLRLPLNKKIQLIIGTNEENVWYDIEAYTREVEKGLLQFPTFGFTPDSVFPVTTMEPGYVDLFLTFAKQAITPPTGNGGITLVEFSGGSAVNTVPASAKVVLKLAPNFDDSELTKALTTYPSKNLSSLHFEDQNDLLTVTIKGRAAHTSTPDKGRNAIALLCQFLYPFRMHFSNSEAASLIAFVGKHLKPDDFFGKSLGLSTSYLSVAGTYVSSTKISPTLISTDQTGFVLTLNVRPAFSMIFRKDGAPIRKKGAGNLPYSGTGERISEIFQGFAQAFDFTFALNGLLEPILVDAHQPFVNFLLDTYGQVYDQEVSGDGVHKVKWKENQDLGTSYAKAMPNIVGFGPVFPDGEDTCHETSERISLKEWMAITKIYAHALARFAAVETSLIAPKRNTQGKRP